MVLEIATFKTKIYLSDTRLLKESRSVDNALKVRIKSVHMGVETCEYGDIEENANFVQDMKYKCHCCSLFNEPI